MIALTKHTLWVGGEQAGRLGYDLKNLVGKIGKTQQ
jgi:hypothetical protein